METGAWPANQRIQYSTMMLYHHIVNSGHKRVAGKILAEQTKNNNKNTMISKVQQITQKIGMKINNVGSMNKSKWKKTSERKNRKVIEERTNREMINKKSRKKAK